MKPDQYNTLKQEMVALLAKMPAEDMLPQWLKTRRELAEQLFAAGESLEKEGHFFEAVSAYWLSFKATGLLAANKRLYPNENAQKVQDYSNEKLPVAELKVTPENNFYRGLCYLSGICVKPDYEMAHQYFIGAANRGNTDAQVNVGLMYERGKGVQQDYVEAFKWYCKAAEQGNLTAIHRLGMCYLDGKGVSQDYAQAFKYFSQAIKQENNPSICAMGGLYAEGLGVQQDYAEAVKWYKKAAEQGSAVAQSNLGVVCYKAGTGVQQNYVEAIKWYEKAAEQGEVNAQFNLGWMHEKGEGVPQNEVEAIKWYRKAAEQGNAIAQNNLGNMYKSGRGIQQDRVEAIKWYQKAAEQGYAAAQLNLGDMYFHARGGQKNYAEAFKWYQKAAEQGNAKAQFSLGNIYQYGRGVTQDYAEAVKWYRKAAEQNYANAEYNLSLLYANGQGVPKNDAEHDKWYERAIEHGCERAKDEINDSYKVESNKFSTSSQASTKYRLHYGYGIENAKIMLELCAKTKDFLSQYNYILACGSDDQILALMDKSPAEFCQALQADKLLTKEKYHAKAKILVDKYSDKIDSELLAPILYEFADENFYCDEPDIEASIAYLNRIPEDSKYYFKAQQLLMGIYAVVEDQKEFLGVQIKALNAKQRNPELADEVLWDNYEKTLISYMTTEINAIKTDDLTLKEADIVIVLKETMQNILNREELSLSQKLDTLLGYVNVSKRMLEPQPVKQTGLMFKITDFFKEKPQVKDLYSLLDEIEKECMSKKNQVNNNNSIQNRI